MATFDPMIPIGGGDTIYEHLTAGGAPGETGFWFYLNFEAELVDWTP